MHERVIDSREGSANPELYLFIADSILVVHTFYIVFVVLGLLLVFVGRSLGWRWIYNRSFRYLHLIAIGIVVIQAWAGVPCPLTTWESGFRVQAGIAGYDTSFVSYWLSRLIYYQGPAWVFTLVYTLFGALTLASLVFLGNEKRSRNDASA